MIPHPSKGRLDHRAAIELCGIHATSLEKQGGNWPYIKAILYVVGYENWDAAAQLADAMNVHPDDMEALFFQIRREQAAAVQERI